MKPISFAAALRDPKLLGSSFTAESWRPWHVLAKILSGEPLDKSDMELVKACTGRTVLPKKLKRLYLLCGRRSGKSRFMSALGVWAAALSANWKRLCAPGESAVVMVMAVDRRQAKVLQEYCDGLLEAPLLKPEVRRRTADRIELRSGAVLEICTNDARLVRGRSAIALLGDEACFWRADGESASSDSEVIAAATPALMTAPNGGLITLSSTTYRRKGYLFERWRDLYGRDDADELCWLAPSIVMNNSLSAAEIEREIAADPVKNKAEYLSTWRDDISGYVPVDVLERATDWGTTERPRSKNYADQYCAFVDAASGANEGNDSFAMAICRGGADGVVHLDRLIEFEPPFDPTKVVAELVLILKAYDITQVTGDSHGWSVSEFARHRIPLFPADTKSEYYLGVLPMLISNRFRLLDFPKLRRQYAALERAVRAGGRESIEEPLRSGSHDDLCNVASGAAVTMAKMLARAPQAVVSDFIGVHRAPTSGFPGSTPSGSPYCGNGAEEDAAYRAASGGAWPRPNAGNGGSLVW